MIRFALGLAWRETRAGWRHVLTVLVCIALGVAALVSVGSLSVDLRRTLAREAKILLGGDVEVRSSRATPPAVVGAVERLRAAGAETLRMRELAGMARTEGGASLLVEVKAVDGAYPLYGTVEMAPAGRLPDLLADAGAMVDPGLLSRLGLKPGDRFSLGAATLVVRGVITREPDRPARLMRLGPRVLVDHATLDRSGLITFGSRLRERWLLRLPPALAPAEARAALAAASDDPSIRVAAYDEAQPGLKRFLDQLGTYLGLVGLVSLLVGGVGVAASVATFMRRRRPTIAVLKCLGVDARTLLATYVIQTGLVGLAGSVVGALAGVVLLPLLIALTSGLLPFAIEGRADPLTVVRGIVMGVALTVLCALWPLLRVREVRPAEVLRQEVAAARPGTQPIEAILPMTAGLAALAFWQAGSLHVGGIFVGAALVALLVLAVLGRGVVRLARALPRRGALAWRQGVGGLMRPGGQVAGIVIALGVGVMLLEAVALIEVSLDARLDHERQREAPSFFFVDVQPDQRAPFERLVRETAGTAPRLTPVVRARLAAFGGREVTRALADARRGQGGEPPFFLIREYVLTSAAAAPDGNRLVAGRWWTAEEAAARPRVSLEEDMARRLSVGVGETVAFDVQGVRVEAEVMSIRDVDWQTLGANFFAVLSQGALDGAPTTWIATARVPAAVEARLQDVVVGAFPNVTVVPVRDVLERVSGLLAQMAAAIRAIASFTVGAGLVVMVAALTATRAQRLYESVILRTLGATRGVVARAFAVEYACLGVVAGVGGTALAAALAWIVLRVLLETPWEPAPLTLAAGVVLTVALSLAVGFLTTWRLLGQKPLPVLRRE
jgi:putative ABC transport system permease protein